MDNTWFCLSLLLFTLLAAGVQEGRAECTEREINMTTSCYLPNRNIQNALGNKTEGATCNTTKITTQVCGWLTQIVECIKTKNLDKDNCYPHLAGQLNQQLVIPCNVQQLFNACPDTPCIGKMGDCTGGAQAVVVATSFLWMTSLMTSFLTVLYASKSG